MAAPVVPAHGIVRMDVREDTIPGFHLAFDDDAVAPNHEIRTLAKNIYACVNHMVHEWGANIDALYNEFSSAISINSQTVVNPIFPNAHNDIDPTNTLSDSAKQLLDVTGTHANLMGFVGYLKYCIACDAMKRTNGIYTEIKDRFQNVSRNGNGVQDLCIDPTMNQTVRRSLQPATLCTHVANYVWNAKNVLEYEEDRDRDTLIDHAKVLNTDVKNVQRYADKSIAWFRLHLCIGWLLVQYDMDPTRTGIVDNADVAIDPSLSAYTDPLTAIETHLNNTDMSSMHAIRYAQAGVIPPVPQVWPSKDAMKQRFLAKRAADKILELQKQLNEALAKTAGQEDPKTLLKELRQAERKLAKSQSDAERYKDMRQDVADRLRTSETERERLRAEYLEWKSRGNAETVRKQLEDVRVREMRESAQLDVVREQLRDAKTRVQSLQASEADLRNKYHLSQSEASVSKQQCQDLRQRLRDAESGQDKYHKLYDDARVRGDPVELGRRLQQAQTSVAEWRAKYTSSQSEVSVSKQTCQDLRQRLRDAATGQDKYRKLYDDVRVRGDAGALQKRLDASMQSAAEWRAKCTSTQTELGSFKQRCQDLRQQLAAMSKTSEQYRKLYDDVRVRGNPGELQKRLLQAEAQGQEWRAKFASAQTELGVQRQLTKDARQAQTSGTARLQQALDKERQAVRDLRVQLLGAQTAAKTAQDRCSDLLSTQTRLQTSVASLQKELGTAKIAALENDLRNAPMSQEVEELRQRLGMLRQRADKAEVEAMRYRAAASDAESMRKQMADVRERERKAQVESTQERVARQMMEQSAKRTEERERAYESKAEDLRSQLIDQRIELGLLKNKPGPKPPKIVHTAPTTARNDTDLSQLQGTFKDGADQIAGVLTQLTGSKKTTKTTRRHRRPPTDSDTDTDNETDDDTDNDPDHNPDDSSGAESDLSMHSTRSHASSG